MTRYTAPQLIKSRSEWGCHTFRATGIAAYLLGDDDPAIGGTVHESLRMTPLRVGLCDRRSQEVELDEIEGIRI